MAERNEGNDNEVYDISGGSSTLISRPLRLKGIVVTKALNNYSVAIKNGSTVKKRIPANAAAGSQIPGNDVIFDQNLIIEPDASGTGEIEVVFQYLGPSRNK